MVVIFDTYSFINVVGATHKLLLIYNSVWTLQVFKPTTFFFNLVGGENSHGCCAGLLLTENPLRAPSLVCRLSSFPPFFTLARK